MDSKYKVGLNRLTILIAAMLMVWLATRASGALAATLLTLIGIWLLATAAQINTSHRWPSRAPWLLMLGALLCALLWVEPTAYAPLLWGFPILLMLPQPRWSAVMFALFGTLAWWQVQRTLTQDSNDIQGLFVGLLLFALMLLGQARAMKLFPLWQRVKRRRRLLPRTRLWSGLQLTEDLPREITRRQREGYHADLLLMHIPRYQYWSMVKQCNASIHEFEHCYRLDSDTLGIILISSNRQQARQRQLELLDKLVTTPRARIIELTSDLLLEREHLALKQQSESLLIIEKEASQ